MNGVEVLSEKIIYNTILPGWCLVIGLAGFFVFLVVTIMFLLDGYNIAGSVCCILMASSIIIACLTTISNENSIKYIEQKVTIDKSVPMVEFYDKYKILDQEGRIYTVRERN